MARTCSSPKGKSSEGSAVCRCPHPRCLLPPDPEKRHRGLPPVHRGDRPAGQDAGNQAGLSGQNLGWLGGADGECGGADGTRKGPARSLEASPPVREADSTDPGFRHPHRSCARWMHPLPSVRTDLQGSGRCRCAQTWKARRQTSDPAGRGPLHRLRHLCQHLPHPCHPGHG